MKPARKRRWRKWFFLAAAVVLVLAVTLRIALVLALPSLLTSAAAKYDLHCAYDRLDLTVLGADLELWHFVVAPKEGGEPYFHSEYCRADVSILNLLRGRLVVRRMEADGIDLLIERDAQGRFPLLERLRKGAAPEVARPAPPPEPLPSGDPEPRST